MKRSILFLLSICVLLFSCSDKDDPIKEVEKPPVETKDPFITLKKSNIDFTNEGGSESILIESNVSWTAKSSASWCTVTPSSGDKSTTSITLSAPANEDYDNRSCTVTIESGNISKTITVNQGEGLGLLITQDRYELGNEESTITVEVKANVEFEVEINDEWITKIEKRGLVTTELEFNIAENDTYGNREGSITIKQKDGDMVSTITIFQSQEDAIILSEKEFDLSSEAQSIEVEVKTNIDYEIIIPEDAKDWVSHASTRALRTETVVLDIAKNEDYDERTVEVVVKDKKTDLEETVTIKQAANTGLIVSEDKYELSNDGGTIEVEVKANVEFDIEIADSWITRVETRGLTATKLQFQVAKNESYDNREGTITIKQKDGNLSSTIKVYQSQKDAIIISEKIVDLSQEKQAIEVELKTNVEFQVIIPEAAKSWVSYTPTRGLRTETLTLNIAENKDYTARSTEVYVKNKKTNLQDTLTINQAANTGLIVSTDKYELTNDGGTIEVEVKANVEFDIEISDNWITRVETRGLTETKLQFQVAKNESYDNREGTITIKQKDGNLSSTIKVYQSQKDAIILTDKELELTNEAQSVEVEIKTNIDYEVIIPEEVKSWVAYVETRALRTETVVLEIAENTEYDKRTAEITIKNKETKIEETLTIDQAANSGLIVSEDKYELSNDGGTIEIEVKANVEFDIEIADSWITRVETRGLTTTILTFEVAKNESYSNREGSITISQTDGDLSSTISIYQSQENAIILSEKELEVSDRSQILDVVIKTNIDFEVTLKEDGKDWVSYTPTRGLRDETVSFNISENKTDRTRSTEVYIKDKLTSLQEILTITQMGKEPGVYYVERMGTLGSMLNQTQKDTITTMIVKGEINKADFNVMKSQLPKLKYIDLKDVKCERNRIPAEAFGDKYPYYNSNKVIDTIILPESITEIGEYAFSQCSGLTGDLIIPDGVTTIGSYAFHRCSGFTGDLILPDRLTEIGGAAFSQCSGFTGNLILPDGLTTIGENAFQDCSNLTGDLILPDRLTEIGGAAFSQCSGFTGNLILPDGLTEIEWAAFDGCTGFTGNLILPDGLTTIGNSAFSSCSGFTGNLILPEGVTNIENHTFSGCSGLTGSLILPKKLAYIGYAAFSGCSGLTGSLILPKELNTIGEVAFTGCSGLTSLTLPDELTAIGSGAFQFCSGLSGSLILPKNLSKINSYTFNGCSGFTGNLIIPDGVTEIKSGAFYGCSGFTGNLILPDGVITIETQAFYNCYSLTGLTIGKSVTTINERAFYGCSGLTGNLILPDGVTTIGSQAFYNCSGFRGNLTIPDGVITIENSAFNRCYGLTGLTIGKNVTTIHERAFYGCSNITGNVVFPASLTSTRNESFSGCNKVEAFQFPHISPLGYYPNMLPSGATVKVPTSAVATYKATNGWKDHTIVGY